MESEKILILQLQIADAKIIFDNINSSKDMLLHYIETTQILETKEFINNSLRDFLCEEIELLKDFSTLHQIYLLNLPDFVKKIRLLTRELEIYKQFYKLNNKYNDLLNKYFF